MTKPTFTGVYPILPTPFNNDETVDLDSTARIVRFMVDIGVDGVTILGVLGEANRLIDQERQAVIRTAVQAADGKIPIIVGTSHSGTKATVLLSQMAADLGASGIMVTPHREPTPNEQRIFDHFATVGSEIDLPIVLQDHPISTQVHCRWTSFFASWTRSKPSLVSSRKPSPRPLALAPSSQECRIDLDELRRSLPFHKLRVPVLDPREGGRTLGLFYSLAL